MRFQTYLPIEPLLDLFPGKLPQHIAGLTGIDPGNLHRYIQAGRLRWDTADQAAIRIGLHPSNIWPDEWPKPSKPGQTVTPQHDNETGTQRRPA